MPPALNAVCGTPTGGLIPRLLGKVVGRVVDKTEAAHGYIIAHGNQRSRSLQGAAGHGEWRGLLVARAPGGSDAALNPSLVEADQCAEI